MDVNEYFSKLNYKEINRKINDFDNLNFKDYTDEQLLQKIIDIFAVNNKIHNPIYTIEVPTREYYCRIRKNYDFVQEYLKSKKFDQNCIFGKPNPNMGRMNKDGENGLYLSKRLRTAIKECRINENEIFTCGIFEFVEPLNILLTFVDNKYYEVSKKYQKKAELLNQFLYKYLTMESKNNDKQVYRITNLFNKIFLEYMKNDGYLYASSVDNSYNLFIRENSLFKCNLSYIFVGKFVKSNVQVMGFIKIENGEIIPKDVLEKDEVLSKLM